MNFKPKSIRPFIGAKDFDVSKLFYRDLGFEETNISHNLSVFTTGNMAFYLQDAYIKDWIDNTMIFLEVENVEEVWNRLNDLNLIDKYKEIRLVPIKTNDWGRECFITDPSGILWHFGEFFN